MFTIVRNQNNKSLQEKIYMLANKVGLKTNKGFTLIELMIVVAIIGILASIAYPSYVESVAKARRADAKGALLNFANSMERYYTVNNTYCGAVPAIAAPIVCNAANDVGAPRADVYVTPVETAQNYTLTITAVTAATYTLTATRAGSQTSDKCGSFTLTHTGVRNLAVVTVTAALLAECW